MNKYTSDIRAAVDVLRNGGVILYPTDTVWGLGCDATNSLAVKKIFDIKKRSDAKALITLVGDIAQLERTVDAIPDVAYQLIEFSDRPLTIVYDRPLPSARLAPELISDDGTIAVRLSHETFSAGLCKAFRKPLVSTSANISGAATPRVFSEISHEIIEAVDYVCLSRRNEMAVKGLKPSSIMRLSESGEFKIIRK
ncbi:MAG: threonylcarbamoyl-AMP synthase [Muribaculaceae bacterium]|nr:threonylcarbamoyl-AMP synthase [Muribaculaceae bacterium]